MSTAVVYINPALPIRIEHADRMVYLADGSQHVLDANDRPLFTAPAGTGVCIVMEYSVDKEPDEAQVAPFARREHAEKVQKQHRDEVAAEKTQPIQQLRPEQMDMVNVSPSTGTVVPAVSPVVPLQMARGKVPFPPVQEIRPQQVEVPGDMSVKMSAEVPGDVTGEVRLPDFSVSPKEGIPGSGESSPSEEGESKKSGRTRRTAGRGRAAG